MRDAFAEYTAVAIDLFGRPTRREVGQTQELRWRGQVATVAVVGTKARVLAAMALNKFFDDLDSAIEVDSRG